MRQRTMRSSANRWRSAVKARAGRLLLRAAFLCVAGCAQSANPDGGLPSGSCVRDQEIIGSELGNIYRGKSAPCASHADCALLDVAIPCQSSCAAAVLATEVGDLSKQVTAYGRTACPLTPGCVSSGNCVYYDSALCTDAGFCARGFADGGLAE